jgi:hypothetical protein
MYQPIIDTITSADDAIRHRTEHELLTGKDKEELLRIAEGLEFFRKHVDNLYHRVRACLFIHAIYRYYLIDRKDVRKLGCIPYAGIQAMFNRAYPMERDLRFLWEELSQQKLDEQAQKVQNNLREAYIQWARSIGEGDDYLDNVPLQRFNPPGHFYEIPNMLRNGTLARLLQENPALQHLMVHNADTLGVFLSPIMLGMHHLSEKALNFEVTPRRYEDKGGGLARVNDRVQLVEALALPREEDEFKLTYYNTLTNWINIDRYLATLGLTRADVLAAGTDAAAKAKINAALQAVEERMPTYVTIKDVKLLWGAGQEDVFPVAQFERLWGDITWLPEFACGFLAVERRRGQQLKDPAQLDRWVRDGSRDYVASKARFASRGR